MNHDPDGFSRCIVNYISSCECKKVATDMLQISILLQLKIQLKTYILNFTPVLKSKYFQFYGRNTISKNN